MTRANEYNACVNTAARFGVTSKDILDDISLDVDDLGEPLCTLPGSPHNWLPPQPPPTFKGYLPNPGSGTPATFDDIDNPARWDEFMFQPKYTANKHDCHLSPSGARVGR